MKTSTAINVPSTFQELANFMSHLSHTKNSSEPLLKKAETPSRLVYRLEKQFPK